MSVIRCIPEVAGAAIGERYLSMLERRKIFADFRPTRTFRMNHCSSQLDPEGMLVTELTIPAYYD